MNGDTPLELLRETAARSPQAVLFAEEAGNTTAQGLVDLAGTRLEAYRRAGIGPGCRVGAIAWPGLIYLQDLSIGQTSQWTFNVAWDLAVMGFLLGSVVAVVLYLFFKFLLEMGWLPSRH